MPKIKFTATPGLWTKWNGGTIQWVDGTVHDLSAADAKYHVETFPRIFSYVVDPPVVEVEESEPVEDDKEKSVDPPDNKAATKPRNKGRGFRSGR